MSVSSVLIIVLLLLLFGVFPRQGGYSANWGYFPAGGVGLVVVILLVLVLLGRL